MAPKTSTDKLPMQSTVQKHTEATPGDDHPRHRPRSVLLRPNAPTPRPARDRPAIAPCPMIRASCQCDVPCPPTRDDMSSLTSVTSEAQGVLVSRPVSPEHPSTSSYTSTCLLECGRLCNLQLCSAGTAENCTSKPTQVPPSRSDAPSTSHWHLKYSVPLHTRQRTGRTNDIANARRFLAIRAAPPHFTATGSQSVSK